MRNQAVWMKQLNLPSILLLGTELLADTMDDDYDEKDDTKRKSRNLSEKKRRDQFNLLVNELGTMVNTNRKKVDKSTVLKSAINFLKNHNEIEVRSRVHEIQEDWKPSFLTNEEFTYLTLEALDGFIVVFSAVGRIHYVSESITSLLGYLPNELLNATIYEIVFEEDQLQLRNILLNSENNRIHHNIKRENQVSFTCHVKVGGLDFQEEPIYELVHFIGYFRTDKDNEVDNSIPIDRSGNSTNEKPMIFFVGTGRLQTPQLIREMSVVDGTKTEFTSRHSLEWKFLSLDYRAPPIIGYLPFEVLGTSGYDYYHVDDLDKVVTCHESLMQKGEGTSCHYRFLTKGQQWIWLQTRYYITYNQWNSKPEFIVCTHHVKSCIDVVKQMRKASEEFSESSIGDDAMSPLKYFSSNYIQAPATSSKSPRSQMDAANSQIHQLTAASDTTSISTDSKPSRQSQSNSQASRRNVGGTLVNDRHKVQIQQKRPKHSSSFSDIDQYSSVPMESIVSCSSAKTSASLEPALQMPEMLHQQNVLMASTQNQMQDELRRRHEELEKLIVRQQEELKRVSEQLLIARYGILSPLLNVGIPYNSGTTNQPQRIANSSTQPIIRPNTTQGIQGVNVLPVPITFPVPLVSPEVFSHSLPSNSVPAVPMLIQDNALQMIPTQTLHPQPMQQQQQQQQFPQSQHQMHSQQQNPTEQGETPLELMTFQIYPPSDLIYTNMNSASVPQQRSNRDYSKLETEDTAFWKPTLPDK